ncbi:PAS domain-containing protein [Novosphingobium tardum]|uniref:histidine kinase n=1 Tax=Novosphingobium tardum TaxID=1538021 RepID=A0ABV8RMU8_9SPHN
MDGRIDFAALFHALPSPYMILDRELRYIDANEAYLSVTGRSRDEIMGRYVFEAFPETAERERLFGDAFRGALAGEPVVLVRQRFDILRPPAEGGGLRQVTWTTHQIPVRDQAGEIIGVLQKALDVSSEVAADESRQAVLREFDHRLKNLIAKVNAISELTAREEKELGSYLEKMRQRLGAVARTQTILIGGSETADVGELLNAELEPYGNLGKAAGEGPPVPLTRATAQTLGMAFHELAVNSAKYGALKHDGGKLDVRWSVDPTGKNLHLAWHESGFSATQPTRRGFGTTIIERLLPMDTGGAVERAFDGLGHRLNMVVPLQHEADRGIAPD